MKIVQEKLSAFRVLIADRDSMSSDLLANALARHRTWETAAIDPQQLLHSLSTVEPDLVVLGADLNSKPGSGFDLVERTSRSHPDVRIVMLINHPTKEAVLNAFRFGVRGIVSRQQPLAELLDCIDHVQRGHIWAGPREADALLEAIKCIPNPVVRTDGDSPVLTAREMQVVQCASKGMTNRAIASELGLSEHTVKNYMFRVFEKLGVSSRVELLFYLTLPGHTFQPREPEQPRHTRPDLSIAAKKATTVSRSLCDSSLTANQSAG